MIEKILVPLDGSKEGEAALLFIRDYTSMLAPEVKIEIHLLHVITQLTHYKFYDDVVTDVGTKISYTEEELKQLADKAMDYLYMAGESLKNMGTLITAKVGLNKDASKEIIKTAEKIKANLIAISTHGRSGLSRLAFGSVTDKVLRLEGKVPILVVRAKKYL